MSDERTITHNAPGRIPGANYSVRGGAPTPTLWLTYVGPSGAAPTARKIENRQHEPESETT